jgi:aminoglycoside phosphotransferase
MTVPLAPDPVVPQRDVLLDSGDVAGRLSRVLGPDGPIEVRDCRRVSVNYRPGKRLRVLYRVAVDGGEHHVAASTFRGHERSARAFARAARAAVPTGRLRPVALDEALDTVFWTFPNDRKIRALSAVTDGSPALSLLLGRPVVPQLVTYVPERAATAACVDHAGTTVAYAKVLDAAAARYAHRVHHALREVLGDDDPVLGLPRPLGWSDGAIVSAAAPGRPLGHLRGAALEHALGRLGHALGRLHTLRPAVPLHYAGRRPLELVRATEAIVRARPDAAEDARGLLRRLLEQWPAPTGRLACLHGDAAAHNVLVDDGRITLLDLDEVGLGPAAVDLGRVLAWIRARQLLRGIDDLEAGRLTAAVICGYGAGGPLPSPAALRWHVAAALLTTRAAHAVNLLHPGCAARLGALLAGARELVP